MINTLYTRIIEESKKCDGTWTLSFLTSVQTAVLRLPLNFYHKLINQLIDYIMDKETTDLQRFKIAQLLNSIKFQKKVQMQEIFQERMNEINSFCDSLDNSYLNSPTKKLLLCVCAEPIQKSKNLRYMANSTEPIIPEHTLARLLDNHVRL